MKITAVSLPAPSRRCISTQYLASCICTQSRVCGVSGWMRHNLGRKESNTIEHS
jgi:hypothetical protein